MNHQLPLPPASILYADLREKWKHEDELINQRVTWLLTSQGALFPAFGVLAKTSIEAQSRGQVDSFADFWIYCIGESIVIFAAIVVTHFLREGIFAATHAMNAIKKSLKQLQARGLVWSEVRVDILDVTSRHGTSPARGMVNTFAIIWVGLTLYEVFRLASLAVPEHDKVLLFVVVPGLVVAWAAYRRSVAEPVAAAGGPRSP